MQGNVEGKTLILPAQKPRRQRQVSTAAHRQKFSDSLHKRKNDYMQQRHNEQ